MRGKRRRGLEGIVGVGGGESGVWRMGICSCGFIWILREDGGGWY